MSPARERPPFYKPHSVPLQRTWCYHCFGLKTGFDFAHFTLIWNNVGFSRKLQECIKVFKIVSIPNEKREK